MAKTKDIVAGVCTLVEIGCIAGIAGIAFKRNNDAYHAEMKRIDAEFELSMTQFDNEYKDRKIEKLESEIAELKEKYEIEEES